MPANTTVAPWPLSSSTIASVAGASGWPTKSRLPIRTRLPSTMASMPAPAVALNAAAALRRTPRSVARRAMARA